MAKKKSKALENNLIESNKFKKIFYYIKSAFEPKKIIISIIFAFIFWLGFFGVVLQNLSLEASNFSYSLIQYLIGIFIFIAAFFIFQKYRILESLNQNVKKEVFFKLEYFKQIDKNNKKNITIMASTDTKDYKKSIFYFCSIIIFIVIFSILHKNHYLLSSIGYIISVAIFLFLPKNYRFLFGFFVGAFGFYWITLSFRFEDLTYFIPLGIFGIALIYGIFFYFLLFYNNLFFRFLTAFCLFFIAPLGFNWLNLEYFSAYTIFSVSSLLFILISLTFLKKRFYILSFLFFIFSLDYNFNIEDSKLNAYIVETSYTQEMRWTTKYRERIINNNFNAIEYAINNGFEMVILPENSFQLTLNQDSDLYKKLLDLSEKIIIVVGGLRSQSKDINKNIESNNVISLDDLDSNTKDFNLESDFIEKSYINTPTTKAGFYNSTYIFASGRSIVADKIELVPFGEILPFSSVLKLFGMSVGFNSGEEVVVVEYKGLKIAIANCYEGTMSLPYKKGAKYIIMTSNNAWFAPSTQDIMQKMIIKYYARKYDTFVYHSTNSSPKAIITPNNGDL